MIYKAHGDTNHANAREPNHFPTFFGRQTYVKYTKKADYMA